MTEKKKNTIPILPMFVALVLLSMIFYLRADEPVVEAQQDEVIESSIGLPEDKIIEFVVEKVSDVLRLIPRNVQTTVSD